MSLDLPHKVCEALDYELYRQVYTAGINTCPVAKAMIDASFYTVKPLNYYAKGIYPVTKNTACHAAGYYVRASWFCLYVRHMRSGCLLNKFPEFRFELATTIYDYLVFLRKYAKLSTDQRSPLLQNLQPLSKNEIEFALLFFDFSSHSSGRQVFEFIPQFDLYTSEPALGHKYLERLALGILAQLQDVPLVNHKAQNTLLEVDKYLIRFTLLGATIGLTIACLDFFRKIGAVNCFCNLGDNSKLYNCCLEWIKQITFAGVSLQPLNDIAWQFCQSQLSVQDFLQCKTLRDYSLVNHLHQQLSLCF